MYIVCMCMELSPAPGSYKLQPRSQAFFDSPLTIIHIGIDYALVKEWKQYVYRVVFSSKVYNWGERSESLSIVMNVDILSVCLHVHVSVISSNAGRLRLFFLKLKMKCIILTPILFLVKLISRIYQGLIIINKEKRATLRLIKFHSYINCYYF